MDKVYLDALERRWMEQGEDLIVEGSLYPQDTAGMALVTSSYEVGLIDRQDCLRVGNLAVVSAAEQGEF